MSELNPPDQDEFQAEQNLWDVYRQIHRKKGTDFEKRLARFAADQADQLSFPGARRDFTELCDAGCTEEVLAAIIGLFRAVPFIEYFWAFLVGNPDRRHRLTRTLTEAAVELDQFFPELPDKEDQEKLQAALKNIGHLHPSQLASELRFYTGFLNFAERLAADAEARSISEVLKYVLVGYVRRATGRFRDRYVAGLLGEIGGSAKFDEVAQRMWRSRNYSRLDSHFSQLADFLFAMGVVIGRSRT